MFWPVDINQRQIVEAHGEHWLVCVTLDQTNVERDSKEPTRFALAIRCNQDGTVTLPSEPVRVIQFVPADVRERLDRTIACVNAGHPLGRESMWGGKMVRMCPCGHTKTERVP